MIKTTILLFITLSMSSFTCYHINTKDYSQHSMSFINNDSSIVHTDSLFVTCGINTFLPNNARSRKQNIIACLVNLTIERNLYTDSIFVSLNSNSQIVSSDGKTDIIGKPPEGVDPFRTIVIIGQKGNIKVGTNYVTDILSAKIGILKEKQKLPSISFYYEFDLTQTNKFNYNNQRLRINLGTFQVKDNVNIRSNEILCQYKVDSPVSNKNY